MGDLFLTIEKPTRRGRPKLRHRFDPFLLEKVALIKLSQGSGSLKPSEIAGFYGISQRTVDSIIATGQLPVVYFGPDETARKYPRVLCADLLKYLYSQSTIRRKNVTELL